jgi:hypothetical protein
MTQTRIDLAYRRLQIALTRAGYGSGDTLEAAVKRAARIVEEAANGDLAFERSERHRVEDAALGFLTTLNTLAEACWRVPIKQHERTEDDQAAVEAWTTAVVNARALLDRYSLAFPRQRKDADA